VKIGRFAHTNGDQFWGIVDDERKLVETLSCPFPEWAAVTASGRRPGPSQLGPAIPLADLRTVAPLEPGARILGVGMNYATHLDDSGTTLPVPEHMPGFIKLKESVVGPDEVIRHPPSDQLDYEIELVAVLASALPPDGDATAALLGYTIGNDISVRDAPRPGGMVDLYTMKAQDATTPLGPWIVTQDALGGPGQPELSFSLRVNDELRQHDDAKNMLWSVDRILRSLDARNRLRAGDVVFTGTTGGTGMRQGRFLAPGDVVELEAASIGRLRNQVGPRERSQEERDERAAAVVSAVPNPGEPRT
jgi:2-keto-4-pentenoate hydratase/2-oxohepta-3-ene-1,7-dioic acid hydratase in catechol pathway